MTVDTISIKPNNVTICAVQVQLSGQGELPCADFEETKRRTKITGYSILKQILVDAMDGKITDARYVSIDLPKPDVYLSLVIEPCGGSVQYATPDDIPEESVPCPCGDKTHWMIHYLDLRR